MQMGGDLERIAITDHVASVLHVIRDQEDQCFVCLFDSLGVLLEQKVYAKFPLLSIALPLC